MSLVFRGLYVESHVIGMIYSRVLSQHDIDHLPIHLVVFVEVGHNVEMSAGGYIKRHVGYTETLKIGIADISDNGCLEIFRFTDAADIEFALNHWVVAVNGGIYQTVLHIGIGADIIELIALIVETVDLYIGIQPSVAGHHICTLTVEIHSACKRRQSHSGQEVLQRQGMGIKTSGICHTVGIDVYITLQRSPTLTGSERGGKRRSVFLNITVESDAIRDVDRLSHIRG